MRLLCRLGIHRWELVQSLWETATVAPRLWRIGTGLLDNREAA